MENSLEVPPKTQDRMIQQFTSGHIIPGQNYTSGQIPGQNYTSWHIPGQNYNGGKICFPHVHSSIVHSSQNMETT